MTDTSRHLFCFETGRVSITWTTSPTPHWFSSSCAYSLVVRLMVFPYSGCLTIDSTATTLVLSMESETTLPVLTLRDGLLAMFSRLEVLELVFDFFLELFLGLFDHLFLFGQLLGVLFDLRLDLHLH